MNRSLCEMSDNKDKKSNYFSCQTVTNVKISLQIFFINHKPVFPQYKYPSAILKALVSVGCIVLQVYLKTFVLKTVFLARKLSFFRQDAETRCTICAGSLLSQCKWKIYNIRIWRPRSGLERIKSSIHKLTWNLENWDRSSAFTYMNMSLLQVRSCTCFICHSFLKERFINHSKPCIILGITFSSVSQLNQWFLEEPLSSSYRIFDISYESPHRTLKPCQRPSSFQMCTDRDSYSFPLKIQQKNPPLQYHLESPDSEEFTTIKKKCIL